MKVVQQCIADSSQSVTNNMTKNRKDLTPRRSSFRGSRPRPNSKMANMRVVVRVRPPNGSEAEGNSRSIIKVVDKEELIFDPEEDSNPFFYHGVIQKRRDLLKKVHKNLKFEFDRIFSQEADNDEVFLHSTKDLVENLMNGYNSSVFVYGATGAGKTHTMLGHSKAPGITLLTIEELLNQKEALQGERDFELAVSYLEIYNENVQDLLNPQKQLLHLREDAKFGVMVPGITMKLIKDPNELFKLLDEGNRNRTQHPTDANAESSRSHAVFQVFIRMQIKATGKMQMAKLSMIDLAGSERGAATGCKGARFTEGANINKSLLALGNCINNLADGKSHIPYRDSKLTRLLKDSLGGNCRTVMIANISPTCLTYEDTYNTLKYATRAKKIKSNVQKNVVISEKSASYYMKVIEDLTEKVKSLEEQQSECAKCKANALTMVSHPPIEIPATSTTDHMASIQPLFEEYKAGLERLHRLESNKRMVEMRVKLKDETNQRLSAFVCDTPDKELCHKKLNDAMDRLNKQANTFETTCGAMQKELDSVIERIHSATGPDERLKSTVELELSRFDRAKIEKDLNDFQNICALQSNELVARGALTEDMAKMMKQWYYLMRARNIMSDEMTRQYRQVSQLFQNAYSVTFEGDADETKCVQVATPVATADSDESRTLKRKLANDLDSTFVLGQQDQASTISAQQILGKVVGYQPSPAKRPAKAAVGRMKENRLAVRKPVGTMGTASRFPASAQKVAPSSGSKVRKRV